MKCTLFKEPLFHCVDTVGVIKVFSIFRLIVSWLITLKIKCFLAFQVL